MAAEPFLSRTNLFIEVENLQEFLPRLKGLPVTVPERMLSLQYPMIIHLGDTLAHQLDPDEERDKRVEKKALEECPEAFQLGLSVPMIEGLMKTVPESANELLRAIG